MVGEDVVEHLLGGEAKVLTQDEVHGGDGGAEVFGHKVCGDAAPQGGRRAPQGGCRSGESFVVPEVGDNGPGFCRQELFL